MHPTLHDSRIPKLEIQTLAIAVGAGLWLGVAQPFDHATGPIYRYMRLADEWTWATALILGATLCALGIGAGWSKLRMLGLMTIGLVWLLMALCFVFGNPHAFTTWTYASLSVSAIYSSLHLQR